MVFLNSTEPDPAPRPLAGRVAVVTGATKNIGLATAHELAGAGADLVITARTAHQLEEVARRLEVVHGGRVVPVAGDICDPGAVDELVSVTMSSFGGVDVVVNNALIRIPPAESTLDATDDDWDAGLAGYIKGPARLLRGLVPSMRARGHGSIVNLVSTAAFSAVPGLGAYGTSKAAMWAWSRYLAAELAPEIRVNAVCPGTTSEEGADAVARSPIWQKILPLVPLARMGAPEECARAVLFLASDASSYTTGQVIFVDGGRVALSSSRSG